MGLNRNQFAINFCIVWSDQWCGDGGKYDFWKCRSRNGEDILLLKLMKDYGIGMDEKTTLRQTFTFEIRYVELKMYRCTK